MRNYHSDLEKLWKRRGAIDACIEMLRKYRTLKCDAEHMANDPSEYFNDYGEVTDDGEYVVSEEEHQRAYDDCWASHVSKEDRIFDETEMGECGSVKEILSRADALVEAIEAARERGCESALYGIRRSAMRI